MLSWMCVGHRVKAAVILVRVKWNFNLINRFSKSIQISNVMKMCRVGGEVHADGQTERHDEKKNSRFSLFCDRSWNSVQRDPVQRLLFQGVLYFLNIIRFHGICISVGVLTPIIQKFTKLVPLSDVVWTYLTPTCMKINPLTPNDL
jgi:hypothetical protein